MQGDININCVLNSIFIKEQQISSLDFFLHQINLCKDINKKDTLELTCTDD